jgi:hypothetical protein
MDGMIEVFEVVIVSSSSSRSSRRMNVLADPADECGNIIDGTEMEGAIICGG